MSKEAEITLDYLEGQAGQGFESMGANDVSTPLLLITQQLSQLVQDGKVPAGHFVNSLTGYDYGTSVRVVVCHFEKCWVEWKPNGGGFVARYPVGEIEVTGDTYSGMKNPATGNDVIETWMYLCVLPDHPEDGFVVLNSTRGNLKYLKSWNTQLKFLRTPGGKPAPVFAGIWKLTLNQDTNKVGQRYYSCNENGRSSITFDEWVPRDIYESYVVPCRTAAQATLADNRVVQGALEAPETTEAY